MVEITEGTAVLYVNHAELASSIYEFSMAASRLPTNLAPDAMDEARATGVIKTEALVQLIMPPTMIPGLIRALISQRESYEARFGKINEVRTDE